jgi:putative peptide zinc metalloprotease protein
MAITGTWLLVVAGPIAGGATAAHADATSGSPWGSGGGDNIVSVNNTTDSSLLARSNPAGALDDGNTVANQNFAYAHATCTGCRTVAVAVQIVVVEGAGTDFRPTNAAVAINENCQSCQTFAFARQFVLSPHRRVQLSDQTWAKLAQLRQQMASESRSLEPFAQMGANLESLSQEMVGAVQADLQRSGGSGDEQGDHKVDEKD